MKRLDGGLLLRVAGVVVVAGLQLACDEKKVSPIQPTTGALQVSLLNPSSGPLGGTTVQISGADFKPGVTVTFDTTVVNAALVTGPTVLSFTAPPPAPGPVEVAVSNPGGEAVRLARGLV